MLNRGETGSMVYEPDHLRIAPGDSVRFLVGHRSHNAASIEGMMPEGAEPFIGRIDEEIEITLDVEGTYGIKCSPHLGMGMVMVVQVGDGPLDTDLSAADLPPRARERFEEIFARAGD